MTRSIYIPALLAVALFGFEAQAQMMNSGSGGGQTSPAPSQSASTSSKIASVQGKNTSLVKNSDNRPSHQGPNTHTVANGDTLWSISTQYLSNPMLWPQLWAYNPQVTNPHWIYPGDTIFLEPYDEEIVVPEAIPDAPQRAVQFTGFNVPGFYLDKLPESRGHILFSDQGKSLIAPTDEVQIDFVDINTRKKAYEGQKYTIFEESKPVLNEDGDPMAYKLIRLGSLQIIDHQPKSLSTAVILEASREISRGNLIIPDEDLVYTTERTSNGKNMEGRIIDSIDLVTQLSAEQYVIINRGTKDGVQKGNSWVVFEQREGLNRLPKGEDTKTKYGKDDKKDIRDGEIEREDEQSWVLGHETEAPEFFDHDDLDEIYEDREYTTNDLPLRKIGDILVIDVKDKFCTGIIMGSKHEIGIDTRVVMIKGE